MLRIIDNYVIVFGTATSFTFTAHNYAPAHTNILSVCSTAEMALAVWLVRPDSLLLRWSFHLVSSHKRLNSSNQPLNNVQVQIDS